MSLRGERLCRLLDAAVSRGPWRRLIRSPAAGDRSSPADFARWEYEHAAAAFKFYHPFDDVRGAAILDVGCGCGGKSVFLSRRGAAAVAGVDVVPARLRAAREFAAREGAGGVRFLHGDAAALPFAGDTFDVVCFNDSFEHLGDPGAALGECRRVLKPGGRVWLAFPPWGSPWGAHLFGHLAVPWAQHLFPDEVLVKIWKERFFISVKESETDGHRVDRVRRAATVAELHGLNGMTVARFDELTAASRLRVRLRRLETPRPLPALLARVPRLREWAVRRVAAVLEKA